MKKVVIGLLFLSNLAAAQDTKNKMQPLFNGKDLNGWYSFLEKYGKNNDVEKVFSVDGGVLHISGKQFGYIATEKLFENFHLVVEFKWGTKKYPPRDADSIKRDNGILYFVPANGKDKVWPKSIECQIQEGDVGDFWMVDHTTIEIGGKRTTADSMYLRVIKKKDAEKPTGEWNKVEVMVDKGNITYLVNDVIVNEAKNPSINKGKIIIQSEGAEIYYRKIEIAEW